MRKIKKKAAQATIRTSPLTIKPRSALISSGFSLLEVIITVSIIAAIVTLVLPKISNRNNEMRAIVRRIAVLSRDLKARAKLNNATYRLAINMSEEDRKPKHEFWVERATGQVLNEYDPENPPSLPNADKEKKDKDETSPSLFSPDTRVMKKPEILPEELLFESVELGNLDEAITSGIVYIHYLPTGYADEAAIHLKLGEKLKWTLAIDPLTGRVDVLDHFRALEELRAK